MNKWQALKQYINSKPIGTIITRKEILKYLEKQKIANYVTTIDTYRMLLSHVGILDRVMVGPHVLFGSYKIAFHIKEKTTLSQIRKAANPNSWESWFYDIKEIT